MGAAQGFCATAAACKSQGEGHIACSEIREGFHGGVSTRPIGFTVKVMVLMGMAL